MAIKRNVRIDRSKLDISETPEADRRQLLENAHSKVDNIMNTRLSDGSGALRIRERLNQRGLFLTMNDLMGIPNPPGQHLDRADVFQGMDTGDGYSGMLTEEFPTAHDNLIMEENTWDEHLPRRPQRASQVSQRQAPARQSLREQITAPRLANWQVKAFLGETRSGGQVPVWKVVNGKTGTAIDKLFRIESIANRIAGYLNESGDSNDPRALSLMHAYDKRDKLLKEARLLEKSADGKPMKTERLKAIRAEINQLDYRLGI